MRQVMAWAALVCLSATGCAQSGLLAKSNWNKGEPVHVARSRMAPRPDQLRSGALPGADAAAAPAGARLAEFRARANVGCEFGDECYQCSCDVQCGDGCGDGQCGLNGGQCGVGGGCGPNGCGPDCGGRCRLLAQRIAGGFCGDGCLRGFNPHAGGYPEMTNFNAGPPVGQVAYPYYTVRGPRDFLRNNPPTIGPY